MGDSKLGVEMKNPEMQNSLSTHYISRIGTGNLKISNFYSPKELEKHFCQKENSKCLDLNQKVVDMTSYGVQYYS